MAATKKTTARKATAKKAAAKKGGKRSAKLSKAGMKKVKGGGFNITNNVRGVFPQPPGTDGTKG